MGLYFVCKGVLNLRKGADIQNFNAIISIEDGLVTYVNKLVAKVIKLDSLNLSLLDYEEQKIKVNQLATVLRGYRWNCSIVKLERPVDLTKQINQQAELLKVQHRKFKDGNMDETGYQNRLKQVNFEKRRLEYFSDESKVFANEFYFIMYGKDLEELRMAFDDSMARFRQIKLNPVECRDTEIKFLFYHMYNLLGAKTYNDFEESTDYLADILPESIKIKSDYVQTDSMYATSIAINRYPLNVNESWLAPLTDINSTSCIINIKDVATEEAKQLMDKAITEVRTQLLNKNKSSEDIAKQAELESFLYILEEIERGSEVLKRTNVILLAYSDNERELKNIVHNAKSIIKQASMRPEALKYRQLQGYVACIPTPRDDLMDDLGRDLPCITLGASFPFVFQSLEDDKGFLLGNNRSNLIFFDPKVRSPSRTNSNIMVIGKSGSGKSHFTKKMVLRLLLQDIKVYIVDPEGEYNILCKKLGGQMIDVGSALDSRINPFHIFSTMLDEDDEETEETKMSLRRGAFSGHIQFLEQFFSSLIPDLTNKELSRLSAILVEAYNKKKITEVTDFESLKAEDYPIMDDVMEIIQAKIAKLSTTIAKDSNRVADLGDELADLRNLEVYMKRLASGGSLANLWNGYTTINTKTSDFILFDFKKMNNSKNDRVMNAQMMLVLRFLENEVSKNRENNLAKHLDNYIAIIVDEAHVFIDEKSPVALQFMFNMVKRIRKYNGIFVVITQNVNDFVGSANIKKYTTAIINGCQYSFIFGLNPADLQSLVDLYSSVGGFSEEERMFIGNAGIGQCLFIVSPNQRILMEKIMISKDEESVFSDKAA